MDKSREILKYIPANLWSAFNSLNDYCLKNLNEISFISGQAITVKICAKRSFLASNGITYNSKNALHTSKNDIKIIYELITESSVYAYNRFINDGFLTLKGGHRVGIGGSYIYADGKISGINYINSLCFRISHNNKYNYNLVFDEIYNGKRVYNTLVISPPGCGKTTLLRSIVSYLSSEHKNNNIIKCCLIDERNEIAACYNGEATMDVGNVTSVISECNKSIAIPLAVRSMSPDIIAVDELSSKKDIDAIKYAQSSGCSVIATTHGLDEKNNKLTYYNNMNIFDKIIILSEKNGPGTVEKVIDGDKIS